MKDIFKEHLLNSIRWMKDERATAKIRFQKAKKEFLEAEKNLKMHDKQIKQLEELKSLFGISKKDMEHRGEKQMKSNGKVKPSTGWAVIKNNKVFFDEEGEIYLIFRDKEMADDVCPDGGGFGVKQVVIE